MPAEAPLGPCFNRGQRPLCHEFVVAYQPPVFSILPTQRCLSLTGFQVCLVGEANVDLPATKRTCCAPALLEPSLSGDFEAADRVSQNC